MRWFAVVPTFILIIGSACDHHGGPAGVGTGGTGGTGGDVGQNDDLPSTCDEAFAMPAPWPCEGSPIGTWEAHVACGRGEAPIEQEPPCDDERLMAFSWFQECGYYEISAETWTFSGSSDAGYWAYHPEVCLVSERKQYECEVINAHQDGVCSWSATDGMCSCVHDRSIDELQYDMAIVITENTIETPHGPFAYCRQGDLLWLRRGPIQYGTLITENVHLLKRAKPAPK